MDSLEDSKMTGGAKMSFFSHVFNLNDESKSEFMNVMQYSLLALIPVIAVNKLMNAYVPEADDEKGSLEIVFEIVFQIVVLFIAIILIHRMITYIPTQSGKKYSELNMITVIIPMLVILLSLQTKLGEKVSIIHGRIMNYWNGTEGMKNKQKNKKQQGAGQQPSMTGGIIGASPISSMPAPPLPVQPNTGMGNIGGMGGMGGMQQPMMESFEPMPANGLGGGAFDTMFGSSY